MFGGYAMRTMIAAVLIVLFAWPAAAQTTNPVGDVIFKEVEKRIIEDFFGQARRGGQDKSGRQDEDDGKGKGKKNKKAKKGKKNKDMPPGLANKKNLPPGLARQLERNGILPPGLAKRGLPDDLKSKLPPPSRGQERVIVDNDVVLVEQATGRILDIIQDVIAK
ncbi:MAG: RcnB family protein [Rhodospirillales bacterium]